MPKAMDPSKRFRAVLKCDESKEPRPTFLYPFLTGRQQMAMMEIYEQIDDSAGQLQNMKQAFELAGMFLLGWENQFSPGNRPAGPVRPDPPGGRAARRNLRRDRGDGAGPASDVRADAGFAG